jgi:thiol-disulfide isomerase/thioredoxin
VAGALNFMANLGGANNDVTKKVIEVIRTNIKTDDVKAMLAQLDAAQAQLALVGKPLTIAGRTSTGGSFSLADYKGKVVMIDFWATWCGPCIGELPNVKKAYKDYHDKGFEIVGVSCDDNDNDLNAFTKDNGMTWVQLREKSQTEAENWHPLAKKYGVDGIPAMFLVDREGILRFVDARDGLEKKVAQLLAEPAK